MTGISAVRPLGKRIVVVSTHWTDPEHAHRRSVARRLTHRSHHPVLVVPARRNPVAPADVPAI